MANGKYRIEQTLSYEQSKYKYFDNKNQLLANFYGTFQTNNRGLRQFISIRKTEHKLGLTLPIGNSLKDANLWLNLSFSQRFISFNQEVESRFIVNNFVTAKILKNPAVDKPFELNTTTQIAQNNRRFDLLFSGIFGYKFNSWAALQFSGLFQRFQPSQTAQKVYVSSFKVWDNTNFLQQNELHLTANLFIQKIGVKISAKNSTITNFIYFDTLQSAKQDAAINNILQVELSQKLKIWKISIENQLLWQQISSPNQTIRLPQWNLHSSLYFEARIFPTLLLRTGAVLRYWSAYNANAYSPIIQQFYNQNNYNLAVYPVLDYFISIKIWQAKVFLNAENILQPFLKTTYFTAPNYGQANFLLRFGVYWSLFD